MSVKDRIKIDPGLAAYAKVPESPNPQRSTRKVRQDWPSNTYENLGRGHKYFSLVRCPETWVNVRERDSGHVFRVFVGRPQEVDPHLDYEWAPNATANAIATSGIAPGGEVGSVSTAVARTLGVELIAGPVPYNYGRCVGTLDLSVSQVGGVQETFLIGELVETLNAIRCDECELLEVQFNASTNPGSGTPGITTFRLYSMIDADTATDVTKVREMDYVLPAATAADWTILVGKDDQERVDPLQNVFQLRGSPDKWALSYQISDTADLTLSLAWRVVLKR